MSMSNSRGSSGFYTRKTFSTPSNTTSRADRRHWQSRRSIRSDPIVFGHSQFLHFPLERGPFHSESLGSTVRTADQSARFEKDSADMPALEVFQGYRQLGPVLRLRLQFIDRSVQGRAFRKDDGALDEVFQFAYVAGPAPLQESIHGSRRNAIDVSIQINGQ